MAAVIFLIAAMAAWAQADTGALSHHLKQWRSVGKFTGNSKNPAANEALSHLHSHLSRWLDERIKLRRTAEEMNAELQKAGLLYQEPDRNERPSVDDGFTSLLGKLRAVELITHPDLLEVRSGIGIPCGYQSVLALYRRDTFSRIGYVRHFEKTYGAPVRYRPLVVTPAFIAVYGQDWWCSSTLGGAVMNVYERTAGPLRPVLARDKSFIRRWVDGSVSAAGDTVTFRYGGFSFDMGVMDRPAIERYRIASGKATRIAPLAESRLGVIEEWIYLPPTDAARFATPIAAALHSREAEQWRKGYIYEAIERCGAQRWQIKIENGLYFVLDGANSTVARITDVRRTPIAGCRPERYELLSAPF